MEEVNHEFQIVDCETSQKLENEMFTAIEYDNALDKLDSYDAAKECFSDI